MNPVLLARNLLELDLQYDKESPYHMLERLRFRCQSSLDE